ncbi:sortilin-like isoform X1 [Lytechinus pictus]|uniref:sortilin-like isoform X1 n=1 Tax=Lytechinus pictus TaxID=7653 RepID=UPI0030B9DFBC
MSSCHFLVFLLLSVALQSGMCETLTEGRNDGVYEFTREPLTRSSRKLDQVNEADVAGWSGDEVHGRSARRKVSITSRDNHRRNIRSSSTIANCGVTGDQIDKISNNQFHLNDSNFNLALLWTGKDSKELLALTTMEYGFLAGQSHLWLSLDYGKSFSNIDDRIEGAIIRKSNGIFKSPLDSQRIILISYKSDMDVFTSKFYISKDGARTFSAVSLPFYPEGRINFHTTHQDLLFVQTPNEENKVWLSRDFGATWTTLQSDIQQASWATSEMNAPDDLFMLKEEDGQLNLLKTPNLGNSYQTLQKHVQNFGLQGKFIYAAITSSEETSGEAQHVLHVSTDRGHSWQPTQLPVITSDRFFSVLDMSEGLIFMHVDDPENTGTGTIYTSASDGIVFSESLLRHLFPNGNQVTDFYKVESMRGVYLASQIHEDSTIHTVITYDRGGIWSPVRRPVEVPCTDTGECHLQIHNQYSRLKGIRFPSGPVSDSTATGLLLAHATVASSLELRPPDVYVSSDGGYNWRLALQGPHHLAIANSGGLLVAIPTIEDATDTIKFSYDEGQCWNSYKFTEEKITVTGLLPEPSKKSLNVSIWGYGADDSQWRSFMINFGSILTRRCGDSDFMDWQPHENNGRAGCLLGRKEVFSRVRLDSLCRVSFMFEQHPTSMTCSCDKSDYECDYGFYRKTNSTDCILSPEFQHEDLEYCEYGHEEELNSWGYRKIPGDSCVDGYQPQRDVEKLKARCGTSSQTKKSHSAAVGILVTLVVVLVLALVFILYKKGKFMFIQTGLGTYRYSKLSQGDSCENNPLDLSEPVQGYHDDSDEDMLE